MTGAPAVPSLADIQAAARRIVHDISSTPLVRSTWLSDLTGADVWLKLEAIQPTGSYKIRGAANAVALLVEAHPDTSTIVTASAGNHGLAVATAAARRRLRVRVYVPETAPAAKRDALVRLGADVVETRSYDEAEASAHDDAARTGATFVSPYDDFGVIAGAGTVALEMFTERPDLDTLVVPLGGGGLLSGTAIVTRALASSARVIGAEATASPAFTSALAAGHPVTVDVKATLADGLAGNMESGTRTFGVVRDLTDRVVLVSEAAIARAMRELILAERVVVEGAGGIAVGAVLETNLDLRGRRVGVILSGRNVDRQVLERVLSAASPA